MLQKLLENRIKGCSFCAYQNEIHACGDLQKVNGYFYYEKLCINFNVICIAKDKINVCHPVCQHGGHWDYSKYFSCQNSGIERVWAYCVHRMALILLIAIIM